MHGSIHNRDLWSSSVDEGILLWIVLFLWTRRPCLLLIAANIYLQALHAITVQKGVQTWNFQQRVPFDTGNQRRGSQIKMSSLHGAKKGVKKENLGLFFKLMLDSWKPKKILDFTMPMDDMGDGKIRLGITMSSHTDTWWQGCRWGRKTWRKKPYEEKKTIILVNIKSGWNE